MSNAARAVACLPRNPVEKNGKAVRTIVSYLHGTRELGLMFARGIGVGLTAYSDADHADSSNDRRSVSGTVFSLCGTPVNLTSSTQRYATMSTRKAEFVALWRAGEKGLVHECNAVLHLHFAGLNGQAGMG